MAPLIVDTDPGVDDAYALALAAHAPEVDLRAVTAVFGNVDLPTTTTNARRLLGMLGRGDVPLGVGADRPLIHPRRGARPTSTATTGWAGSPSASGRSVPSRPDGRST